MSLSRFLPRHRAYNALDLEFSEMHLLRVLGRKLNANPVVASATVIPTKDSTATLLVSTEALEHIPAIDEAVQETYRVAAPEALFLCCIPNNYGHKYAVKGPHPGHVNNWTFDGFTSYMAGHGFECIERFMKGRWIPLPLWLTKTSYQLPLTSASEYFNTNFFYVFRVKK